MSKDTSAIHDQHISEQAESLLQELQKRADALLHDLKAFQSCLRSHGLLQEVEVGFFRKGVESEVKSLQSISKLYVDQDVIQPDNDAELHKGKFLHALRSSNLPFYEAVWYTARQRRGVVALGKRISLVSGKFRSKQNREIRGNQEKYGVVDIVADDGLEWIKVSTVTEKRLLFDIAKEGLFFGEDSDDEEDNHDVKADHDLELEIVQLAKHLQSASRNHRVRYQHPKVLFILPKIEEGSHPQIDAVVADIRATGAVVVTASQSSRIDGITTSFNDLRLSPTLDYQPLIPGLSVPDLTSTINIDCTVLLALISDISHIPRPALPPSPANNSGTYHKAILKQIDLEESRPLLPKEIYLVLQGRELICTTHAAIRMQEIVGIMGTETERTRSLLFLGQGHFSQHTAEQLRDALRSTSIHPVPDDLDLPIKIVGFDGSADEVMSHKNISETATTGLVKDIHTNSTSHTSQLSRKDIDIALKLISPVNTNPTRDGDISTRPVLSQINSSVFLYGWLTQIVTVTSNKAVAMQLKKKINELLDIDEREREREQLQRQEQKNGAADAEAEAEMEVEVDRFIGPQIYICDTARSLVGKEKQGQGQGQE